MPVSLGRLRAAVKRNYPASCAYYLVNNFITSVNSRVGNIETISGMAHAGKDITASLAYINEVFSDYKRYAGIGKFYGTVAEIGPGDNCGVGLLFLRDGCTSVDLVDRFYSKRNPEQQSAVYQALISPDPALLKQFGHVQCYSDEFFPGIHRYYGDASTAEAFFHAGKNYDFIVSRAVLEHVYDPALALSKMVDALSPKGMMLHKVDLRDHGMFSTHFHELKFYEVPDWLYPAMTKAAGYPNRVLIDQYRNIMRGTGLECSFLITRLAGVGDIDPHLPYADIPVSLRDESLRFIGSVKKKFVKSIADTPDEDLSITGFFLIAKKQDNRSQ